MNYAGATKAPTQCTSVHRPMCRGLGLSLLHGSNILLLLLLAGQFHLSHDQWALPLVWWMSKSSPPKKDTKSSKPSSPKISPVHECGAAYFTLKTHKGKNKENQMHLLVSLGSYHQITLYLVFLYVSLYLIMYFQQFKWFLINLSLATCI